MTKLIDWDRLHKEFSVYYSTVDRSVIEPIIGHAKNDGLLRRNYLKGRKGDEINAILSGIGFNFRQITAVLAA